MPFLPFFFGEHWFTIVCFFTIGGCVIATSDIKKKIGGVVLIILMLLMDWYLQ